MNATRRRVFGRGSPVLDYWLGHSRGFELTSTRGGRHGVVEDVLVDEVGRPRALVVRSGALQRAHVLDLRAVEAVVPETRSLTLLSSRQARPLHRETRAGAAAVGRAVRGGAAGSAKALALLARAVRAAVVLGWTAAHPTARALRRRAPVAARRTAGACTAAVASARPQARTLARLCGAAAVTVLLLLAALARALVLGVRASARLVAQEWRRRRAAPRRARR